MKVRRIGIAVYDGVTGLDVAGPADVFSTANERVSRAAEEPGVTCRSIRLSGTEAAEYRRRFRLVDP